MELIALNSLGPYVGKTTVARLLQRDYSYVWANHSQTIITDFVTEWNQKNPNLQTTVEKVQRHKAVWRKDLQEYGKTRTSADRFEQTCESLSAWLDILTSTNRKAPCVFDPVRTDHECGFLRGQGFTIVRLVLDRDEQTRRALEKGCTAEEFDRIRSHPVETSVEPDMSIDVTGLTPTQIAEVLLNL